MMEVISRKIWMEDAISRKEDFSWGLFTSDTFYMKVFLTQDIDDMGMFTDIKYYNDVVDYSIIVNKLTSSGYTFPFMSGITPASVVLSIDDVDVRPSNVNIIDYFIDGNKLTATTDSRLEEVKSYNINNPYIVGFNVDTTNYINYQGVPINGVSRVTQIAAANTGLTPTSFTAYTIDGNLDTNLGTPNQLGGLYYKSYSSSQNSRILNGEFRILDFAEVIFKAEGWNQTNVSLSALTKEEYLMGITQKPQIESDVFIDRGAVTVLEKHLRLSEVESLEHLENYGNGFYKLIND